MTGTAGMLQAALAGGTHWLAGTRWEEPEPGACGSSSLGQGPPSPQVGRSGLLSCSQGGPVTLHLGFESCHGDLGSRDSSPSRSEGKGRGSRGPVGSQLQSQAGAGGPSSWEQGLPPPPVPAQPEAPPAISGVNKPSRGEPRAPLKCAPHFSKVSETEARVS